MKEIVFEATDWAQTRTPTRALVLLAEQEAPSWDPMSPAVIAEVEDGVRDRGPDAQDGLAVVEVDDNAVEMIVPEAYTHIRDEVMRLCVVRNKSGEVYGSLV